ncbi:hypothetical protein HDU80_004288 [Chytriomyces hyalinus]|nr:hypothetical protein HDU80_004288 [Chytriomyces hyalinus]
MRAPNPPRQPKSAAQEREKSSGDNKRGMAEFRNVRPITPKKQKGIPLELLSVYQSTIETMQNSIFQEDKDEKRYSPTRYNERSEAVADPFAVPKIPKSRTMGAIGSKDNEDLRQELFSTRNELNAVKQEKKMLLARMHAVERSHDDMERRYQDQLIASTILRKHRSGVPDDNIIMDDKIITKLKTALKNSEKLAKQKELEIEELKQSTKYRSLQKFEEEINRYYLEVVRLKRLMEHQETGTRLLDDDAERLLSYDDAISELYVKLTNEQETNRVLTDSNDRLTVEVERQRSKIDDMSEQLFELHAQHDTLVEEHTRLNDDHHELRIEHDRMTQKYDSTAEILGRTSAELSDVSNRYDAALDEIDKRKQNEERLKELLDDATEQLNATRAAKMALEAEYTRQKETDAAMIQKLELEIAGLNDSVMTLRHDLEKQEKLHNLELGEKQETIDREHRILVSIRAELSSTQQQLSDLETVNAKHTYEITAGKEKLSFLERSVSENQDSIRSLENEVSRQKGMRKSLETQLSERNDKIETLDRKLATYEIQAAELKVKEISMEHRVSELLNSQIETQQRVSAVQIELSSTAQRNSMLENALKTTEEKLFIRTNEVKACNENIDVLQGKVREQQQRADYYESTVAALDGQLSEKHSHVMHANEVIAALEAQIDSTRISQFSQLPVSGSGFGSVIFSASESFNPERLAEGYPPSIQDGPWNEQASIANPDSEIESQANLLEMPKELSGSQIQARRGEDKSAPMSIGNIPLLFSRSVSSTNLVLDDEQDLGSSANAENQTPSVRDINISELPNELSGSVVSVGSVSKNALPSQESLPTQSANETKSEDSLITTAEVSKPPLALGSIDDIQKLASSKSSSKWDSRGRQSSRTSSRTSSVAVSKVNLRQSGSASVRSKRSRQSSMSLHRSPSSRASMRSSRSRSNSSVRSNYRSQSLADTKTELDVSVSNRGSEESMMSSSKLSIAPTSPDERDSTAPSSLGQKEVIGIDSVQFESEMLVHGRASSEAADETSTQGSGEQLPEPIEMASTQPNNLESEHCVSDVRGTLSGMQSAEDINNDDGSEAMDSFKTSNISTVSQNNNQNDVELSIEDSHDRDLTQTATSASLGDPERTSLKSSKVELFGTLGSTSILAQEPKKDDSNSEDNEFQVHETGLGRDDGQDRNSSADLRSNNASDINPRKSDDDRYGIQDGSNAADEDTRKTASSTPRSRSSSYNSLLEAAKCSSDVDFDIFGDSASDSEPEEAKLPSIITPIVAPKQMSKEKNQSNASIASSIKSGSRLGKLLLSLGSQSMTAQPSNIEKLPSLSSNTEENKILAGKSSMESISSAGGQRSINDDIEEKSDKRSGSAELLRSKTGSVRQSQQLHESNSETGSKSLCNNDPVDKPDELGFSKLGSTSQSLHAASITAAGLFEPGLINDAVELSQDSLGSGGYSEDPESEDEKSEFDSGSEQSETSTSKLSHELLSETEENSRSEHDIILQGIPSHLNLMQASLPEGSANEQKTSLGSSRDNLIPTGSQEQEPVQIQSALAQLDDHADPFEETLMSNPTEASSSAINSSEWTVGPSEYGTAAQDSTETQLAVNDGNNIQSPDAPPVENLHNGANECEEESGESDGGEESEGSTVSESAGSGPKSVDNFWNDGESIASGGTASADEEDVW